MDGLTVTLKRDDAELATRLVAEGRYNSTAEVVEAAMGVLRDTVEDGLALDWEAVKAAAVEGEAALARGDYVEFNSEAELKAHLDNILARVEADASGTGQER